MTTLANIKPTVGTAAGSFEFILDVAAIPASGDLTTIPATGTGTWQNIPDQNNMNPTNAAKLKDRTTYANKGLTKQTKRGADFSMSTSVLGIKDSTGEFQAALLLLINAAEADGDANNIAYRYYHATSAALAFMGTAGVQYTRANTGPDDDEWFDITLTGQGDRVKITNPAKSS